MAEFKEVIRKRSEMCKHYGNTCADCPLGIRCNLFHFDWKGIDEFEEIVMNWEKPIKELTIEDANKLPKGTMIEVRSCVNEVWVTRKFVITHKNKYWCETEPKGNYLCGWEHARLKGE